MHFNLLIYSLFAKLSRLPRANHSEYRTLFQRSSPSGDSVQFEYIFFLFHSWTQIGTHTRVTGSFLSEVMLPTYQCCKDRVKYILQSKPKMKLVLWSLKCRVKSSNRKSVVGQSRLYCFVYLSSSSSMYQNSIVLYKIWFEFIFYFYF